VLVYPSEFAGTNQATAASWAVGDDFDEIVEDLRSKGVTFEHYDLPDTTREGDVHMTGDFKPPVTPLNGAVSQRCAPVCAPVRGGGALHLPCPWALFAPSGLAARHGQSDVNARNSYARPTTCEQGRNASPASSPQSGARPRSESRA
jgi:hypothetical protein